MSNLFVTPDGYLSWDMAEVNPIADGIGVFYMNWEVSCEIKIDNLFIVGK